MTLAALSPSTRGIWTSMRIRSETPASERLDGLDPVIRDDHRTAQFAQQAASHELIGPGILGDEDLQRSAVRGSRRRAGRVCGP